MLCSAVAHVTARRSVFSPMRSSRTLLKPPSPLADGATPPPHDSLQAMASTATDAGDTSVLSSPVHEGECREALHTALNIALEVHEVLSVSCSLLLLLRFAFLCPLCRKGA